MKMRVCSTGEDEEEEEEEVGERGVGEWGEEAGGAYEQVWVRVGESRCWELRSIGRQLVSDLLMMVLMKASWP